MGKYAQLVIGPAGSGKVRTLPHGSGRGAVHISTLSRRFSRTSPPIYIDVLGHVCEKGPRRPHLITSPPFAVNLLCAPSRALPSHPARHPCSQSRYEGPHPPPPAPLRDRCPHLADPAAENFNYPVSFDVRDLITLEDVMEELKLGPNG